MEILCNLIFCTIAGEKNKGTLNNIRSPEIVANGNETQSQKSCVPITEKEESGMVKMEALGRQILVEFYDCNASKLNDVLFIEKALVGATKASRATIISHNFHKFSPHGVSGVVVIAESHVTIHTWPEYCYAAVDVFTCGETIDPWIIQERLKELFESANVSSMEMKRGLFKVPAGEKLHFKPVHNVREN